MKDSDLSLQLIAIFNQLSVQCDTQEISIYTDSSLSTWYNDDNNKQVTMGAGWYIPHIDLCFKYGVKNFPSST